MSDMDDSSKRRSACDECRKRKLKCSGQSTACTRCAKQNLTCRYSSQKQMGRPRKRRKVSEHAGESRLLIAESPEPSVSYENVPSQVNQPAGSGLELADQNSCPEPIYNLGTPPPRAPLLTDDLLYEQLGSFSNSLNHVEPDVTPSSNLPATPSLRAIGNIFPSTLDWADYSDTLDLPTSVPNPSCGGISPSNLVPSSSPPGHHNPPANSSTSPSTSPFLATPSCTCLPDLYLNLSDLSALPSLPINSATVETLQSATRTAHTVLYCRICPQRFQSGMQNLMLLATLLTVIADSWSRILRAPTQDLARGFSIDPATSLSVVVDPWSAAKETEWKLFAHYLIRQYVFGDAPPPGIHIPGICPFLSSSASPSKPPIIILRNLCDAFERRQKTFHGLIEATGEFPQPCHNAVGFGGHDCSEGRRLQQTRLVANEKGEHLCLTIVESVRTVLARLGMRPDGGERS